MHSSASFSPFQWPFSRCIWVSRCLLKQRMMEVMVTVSWSYKSCKAPVKSSQPTNQHPVFYRSDALPVTQPTVSKHWREISHSMDLLTPTLPGVFQILSLTTNSSWCYLGEGCHASHQPSDASTPMHSSTWSLKSQQIKGAIRSLISQLIGK